MNRKRRRSNGNEDVPLPKRTRTISPNDRLSRLSSELLIRIFHHLPIHTLLQCQTISHRLYTLTSDSQIWKSLYYSRFVLPRALRIPGIKNAPPENEGALQFSSRRSKWLEDDTLINRKDGRKTDWKKQYRLRHNWSIGACEVQEIRVREQRREKGMLVKLAEGCVVTVDKEEGLRAWDLRKRSLIASCVLDNSSAPTCVAVDDIGMNRLGIAVGFEDGSWGTWRLDTEIQSFEREYLHPRSSNGLLSAIAYAQPYVLTITDAQLLSLYTFTPDPAKQDPRLLASLKSHTCWPPLSLSIRLMPSTIIASIAYSLPTFVSGYTVGIQELHLSPVTGTITSSRLTSALPQGFSSISVSSSPSSGASSPLPSYRSPNGLSGNTITPPTSLSYAHPYILATHPDNTLSLYLCTSTASALSLSQGTKLWGHTSSVSSAEITARGKAVSVSTRGNELRVWSLEGSFSTSRPTRKAKEQLRDRSVQIRHPPLQLSSLVKDANWNYEDITACKHWVGFDDEVVIVLKEEAGGTQALVVYDFT
ncbi:hypothetical protein BJ875DRAFT_369467 [Amylocarpus encephaloides]|uniref:F-box domain-containing protein n=1 Tax=Amylocarpus encephaloides TaxID=45428 RepID=A0A9P7YR35_9HELO|nr:hypothetical protein BJ875DRAFT_369467 [Amylocarpus encephaloides]